MAVDPEEPSSREDATAAVKWRIGKMALLGVIILLVVGALWLLTIFDLGIWHSS